MKQWAEQMWESGQQEWGKLQTWTQDVMGASLPAMEEAFEWGRQQRDRYEQYVVPQMQSLFSEAELYASKGEEERQRAAAIQDTKSAFEAEREAQERKLKGYGVDPTELRYAALDQQAGIAEAAMSAFNANQAGERTKQIGRNLRTEAIAAGQGIAGQGMQSTGQGAQIGGASLGTATGATVGGSQVARGALPYMAGAGQGNITAAGIIDQSYGRDLDYTAAYNAANQQDFDQMMGVGKSIGSLPWGGTKTAEGGPIAAPGGPTDDRGAISISDGEYVVPADVVRKLGTNHFDKLIEKETGRPPPSQKQAIPINPNASPPQAMGMAPRVTASRAGVLR